MFIMVSVLLSIAKLTGHFDYSWWIVMLPLIVPFGLAFIFVGIAGVFKSYIR